MEVILSCGSWVGQGSASTSKTASNIPEASAKRRSPVPPGHNGLPLATQQGHKAQEKDEVPQAQIRADQQGVWSGTDVSVQTGRS